MRKFLLTAFLSLFSFSLHVHSVSQSKIDACNECHGQNGISPNPKYPNLAGQHKSYFIKQLNDMRNHRLHCPSKMTNQLAQLDEKELDELANNYAKMPILKRKNKIKFGQRGKTLYTVGNSDKHIIACIICHGPRGRGNAAAGFPVLAGQSTHYVVEELNAFKRGKRTNDLYHVMQTICSQMSLDDIKAVAQYIEHF